MCLKLGIVQLFRWFGDLLVLRQQFVSTGYLRETLGLNATQVLAITQPQNLMRQRAVALGEKVIAEGHALDRLFASAKASPKSVTRHSVEIGRLCGELRAVRLQAHLKVKAILSPRQVAVNDRLRGNSGEAGHAAGQIHDGKSHGGHRSPCGA